MEELDDPARREPDADLEHVWQRRRAAFLATRAAVTATVRVRAARRSWLAAAAVRVADERPDEPGWLRLDASFGDTLHAERVLWTLADDVEVLAPDPLRSTIAARAAAVAARYA